MPDHASKIGRDERTQEEKLEQRGLDEASHPAMEANLGNPDYRVTLDNETDGQTRDDDDGDPEGQHTYGESSSRSH